MPTPDIATAEQVQQDQALPKPLIVLICCVAVVDVAQVRADIYLDLDVAPAVAKLWYFLAALL